MWVEKEWMEKVQLESVWSGNWDGDGRKELGSGKGEG